MVKRYWIVFLFCLLGGSVMAQQDALYSQYMFNPFTINPAYAGSKEATSGVLLYRTQWVGFEGAPNSQSFSMHTPFEEKNFAVGLNAINDNIGPTTNTGAFLTYAYHIPFSTGKLSLGLRGGAYRSVFNANELNYKEPDRFSGTGKTTSMVPSFDFGAYYYTDRFYAGAAATHLSQQRFGFDLPDGESTMQLKRHYMATAGGAIVINRNLIFRPSTMVKYVVGAPLNFDVNASFHLYEFLWLGASYRSNKSLVAIAEFNITDYLRAGYSYDFGLNKLRTYHSGTHEAFIGFDLNLRGSKSVSPRYF